MKTIYEVRRNYYNVVPYGGIPGDDKVEDGYSIEGRFETREAAEQQILRLKEEYPPVDDRQQDGYWSNSFEVLEVVTSPGGSITDE